ncbi:MAG: class I SAM-dependent methyltransferase [Planctomycetaceae bacterium]
MPELQIDAHAAAPETELKDSVRDFWNRSSCGEIYASGNGEFERFESHSAARYELEPYLPEFAKFPEGAGRDVLEIGVGMGADHVEWAKCGPRSLSGIDLTPRAIENTSARLALYGFESNLRVADAENLPFDDASFDIVYSWGVLHHSPDTPRAIREVFRVLKPGGTARVMIYHKYSPVGYMLWARYGLLRGKPFRSLDDVYFHHLESPGTKAYTVGQARQMFAGFSMVEARPLLCFGDLLEGEVGQRHRGPILSLAKKFYPRRIVKALFRNQGLFLLIEAVK